MTENNSVAEMQDYEAVDDQLWKDYEAVREAEFSVSENYCATPIPIADSDRNHVFLKLKDIREEWEVSRTTVWRWEVERGLKVQRVGGVARVCASDYDKFVALNAKVLNPRKCKMKQI